MDTSKIKPGTKLIGWYHTQEVEKTAAPLGFIIENADSIKQLICRMKHDRKKIRSQKKQIAWSDGPWFTLSILQDYDEITSWDLNPVIDIVANIDPYYYHLETAKIAGQHLYHPFSWRSEEKVFETEAEYESYFNTQKLDEKFLFVYAPEFKYEGSFELVFPKTKQSSSPLAISNAISPLIQRIVKKQDYRLSYGVTDKNPWDPNLFVITIDSPKTLFEKLSIPNIEKRDWQKTVEKATFFYKAN